MSGNCRFNEIELLRKYQENCANLEVLDLSSVESLGNDYVRIGIEVLQKGCGRLRILRLANSMLRLADAAMSVQVCPSLSSTRQENVLSLRLSC